MNSMKILISKFYKILEFKLKQYHNLNSYVLKLFLRTFKVFLVLFLITNLLINLNSYHTDLNHTDFGVGTFFASLIGAVVYIKVLFFEENFLSVITLILFESNFEHTDFTNIYESIANFMYSDALNVFTCDRFDENEGYTIILDDTVGSLEKVFAQYGYTLKQINYIILQLMYGFLMYHFFLGCLNIVKDYVYVLESSLFLRNIILFFLVYFFCSTIFLFLLLVWIIVSRLFER